MKTNAIIGRTDQILNASGKTLDKTVETIESKISNINTDGTLIASKTSLGNVKVGKNIDVAGDGTINVPLANSVRAGVAAVFRVATSVANYGEVHSLNGRLIVNIATSTKCGAIKPGDNCTVDTLGRLNVKLPTTFIWDLSIDAGVINFKCEWLTLNNMNILVSRPGYSLANIFPVEVDTALSNGILGDEWRKIFIKISDPDFYMLAPVAADDTSIYYKNPENDKYYVIRSPEVNDLDIQ